MTERKFKVQVKGPLACFTRPEMKVERVSYEVMTPSAARGVLTSILWKPQMAWQIHSIAVLAPIQWVSFRRNEVNSRASIRTYFADEDRAQRNTVALKDVDYVIEASISLTEKAGPDDPLVKYEEMFFRRLEKGQYHHAPCLGCREFAAQVTVAPEHYEPIDPGVERPLGLLFYDFDFTNQSAKSPKPYFFQARLKGGVVSVPPPEQVFEQGEHALCCNNFVSSLIDLRQKGNLVLKMTLSSLSRLTLF